MSEKTRGYFDVKAIDLDPDDIVVNCEYCLDDVFHLKDLKQRKLFLEENIMPLYVDEIVHYILQYNKEDMGKPVEERQPILLYLTSNGGSVTSGFKLIDAIINSKTPVYTINFGHQYSMGFLIGLAGYKRFASRNATFLMHDGQNFIWDSSSKVQDQVKFQGRVNERVKEFVIQRSKGMLTEAEYDSKVRIEWYMFADEAKEKGFVDYIIGEDCDIDTVV